MRLITKKDSQKYSEMLESVFIFRGVDKCVILECANDNASEWVHFDKGDELYSYKHYKSSLGIILKGKISVNKIRHDEGCVLMNYLSTGDAFGGAAVFSSSETYIALLMAESSSDVLFLSKELLQDLFIKYPTISMNYISYLSDSLVFLNKRLDIFTAGGAEERVAEYIRMNSHMDVNGNCIIPDFCLSRLAEYLAIGRASLYRILNDFENKGFIKKEGKKIYIIKGDY